MMVFDDGMSMYVMVCVIALPSEVSLVSSQSSQPSLPYDNGDDGNI